MEVFEVASVEQNWQGHADWSQKQLAEVVSEATQEVGKEEGVIFFRVKDDSAELATRKGLSFKLIDISNGSELG